MVLLDDEARRGASSPAGSPSGPGAPAGSDVASKSRLALYVRRRSAIPSRRYPAGVGGGRAGRVGQAAAATCGTTSSRNASTSASIS